jgi:hypothetical protein
MKRAIIHIGHLIACGVVTMLTVNAAEGAEPVSPPIVLALEQALSFPGARIDSAAEERSTARVCTAREASVPRPVDGSGRVAVKVAGVKGGAPCEVWTWVRVRVTADVPIAKRPVRAGEPIADAVTTEARELRAGATPARIVPGAVATRNLAAGQVVLADAVGAQTLRPGERVKVVVVSGALSVEQAARSIPCTRGRSCAVLPSGKQVEGDLVDGRLVVALP